MTPCPHGITVCPKCIQALHDQVKATADLGIAAVKEKAATATYYKNLLLNYLAVVHRDGGQHTEKVGVGQSVKDAIEIFYKHLDDR